MFSKGDQPYENMTGAQVSDKAINKKSLSLYSPYYAEACNEFAVPSPRHSAKATQLTTQHSNTYVDVEAAANRLQRCVRFGRSLGFEHSTSRTRGMRSGKTSASGVGGMDFKSRADLPHVANDSPSLQPWSVGPGAKPRRWALLICDTQWV